MATAQFTYDDLYPYQKDGVAFLLERLPVLNFKPHRLLCDEQGLGKTLEVCIAIVVASIQSGLVICPPKLKETWVRQMIRCGVCTRDQIAIIESTNQKVPDVPFLVTSFQSVLSMEKPKKVEKKTDTWSSTTRKKPNKGSSVFRQLMERGFGVVVIDEVQRLKSAVSAMSKLILGNRGPLVGRGFYKWCLSGTITPNRAIELYPVTAALAPECIAPHTTFDAFGFKFCAGFNDKTGRTNFDGASNIKELGPRLRPFLLRRTIDDVFDQLPPYIESHVFLKIDMGGMTRKNTPMATLRKAVGDKKTPHAIEYLKERLEEGGKILAFAFTRTVIEDVTEGLKEFGARKLYGGLTPKQFSKAVNDFINDPTCRVLVAQYNAAGEGTDGLQYATRDVVMLEEEWVPGLWDQAVSRLRRIGQEFVVRVTRLIAIKTLDETMLRVYRRKKKAIEELLQAIKEKIKTMSLESELAELNATVKGILSYLQSAAGQLPAAPAQPVATLTAQATVTPEPPKPADKPPAQKAADKPAESKLSKTVIPPKEDPAKKKITLDDVKNAGSAAMQYHTAEAQKTGVSIQDAQQKAIEVMSGLMAPLGVSSLKELKPEQIDQAFAILDGSIKKEPVAAAAPAGFDFT